MHATFDKRKIHTTFLYEETSADESDWRDLTQQSHIHNNVCGLTAVGESPLFELANSTLGNVCDVSTAMHSSSEISNYPYYSPLQKPDDSLYEPQEPVTSEAKFSTSSGKADASDNYAHLVSLLGASRMDSSTMYAELMSHNITTSVKAAHYDSFKDYPYYSPLQNPDGSLYETQEPVTSEAKFSTSSEKTDASDNYAHLVSLPGASRMDSSTMYAEIMSHYITTSVCESCSL